MDETIEITKSEDNWVNIKVDSQIFSGFMKCGEYYNLHYNRHLVPLSPPSASILKGTLAHFGFHAFNAARIEGKNWSDSSLAGLTSAKKNAIKLEGLDTEDALQVYNTLNEFWEYRKQYEGSEIPLAAERTFCVLIYEDAKIRIRIYLTGRIDYIFKLISSPSIIPLDYKTESESWFYSTLNNQFKFYALATKSNIVIVQRVGFQKTKKPEEKYKIESLNYDPEVLKEFVEGEIRDTCLDLLTALSENKFRKNYTACIQGHFACMFSDRYNNGGICSVSPKIREEKIEKYFRVGQEWSPENL